MSLRPFVLAFITALTPAPQTAPISAPQKLDLEVRHSEKFGGHVQNLQTSDPSTVLTELSHDLRSRLTRSELKDTGFAGKSYKNVMEIFEKSSRASLAVCNLSVNPPRVTLRTSIDAALYKGGASDTYLDKHTVSITCKSLHKSPLGKSDLTFPMPG